METPRVTDASIWMTGPAIFPGFFNRIDRLIRKGLAMQQTQEMDQKRLTLIEADSHVLDGICPILVRSGYAAFRLLRSEAAEDVSITSYLNERFYGGEDPDAAFKHLEDASIASQADVLSAMFPFAVFLVDTASPLLGLGTIQGIRTSVRSVITIGEHVAVRVGRHETRDGTEKPAYWSRDNQAVMHAFRTSFLAPRVFHTEIAMHFMGCSDPSGRIAHLVRRVLQGDFKIFGGHNRTSSPSKRKLIGRV
jgi:hypothetical protein